MHPSLRDAAETWPDGPWRDALGWRDGMWRGRAWAVGAIALLTASERAVMVRKAPRPGYELGGLWSLPGGIVRAEGPFAEAVATSLAARVAAEAGVDLGVATGWRADVVPRPLVTAYTARGARRTTVVLPFAAQLRGGGVAADDPSVTEARWMPLPPAWAEVAPANRLAIAWALWDGLDATQRDAARGPVQAAAEACAAAAAAVGLPATPAPWAR